MKTTGTAGHSHRLTAGGKAAITVAYDLGIYTQVVAENEGKPMTDTPKIECERHHTILPVDDIAAAVEFYTKKLGFWLGFEWGTPVTMAGVNLGQNVQIFLELGTSNPKGYSMYFVVGDADELYEFHRSNGVEIICAPDDRNYGLRDYGVRDLYGYQLSFGHRLPECESEE